MLRGGLRKSRLVTDCPRPLLTMACLSVLGLLAAPGVSSAKAKVKAPEKYYLSLGDSYSVDMSLSWLPMVQPLTDLPGTRQEAQASVGEFRLRRGEPRIARRVHRSVWRNRLRAARAGFDAATIPSGDSQVTAAEGSLPLTPDRSGLSPCPSVATT